ncbi:hypothetical protein U1Q18_035623 [Sarracenia purpurea var. burkii]
MGGKNRQRKSSGFFAFFNIFKSKRRTPTAEDDSVRYHRVWPSDEDRGRYVAEPGIDRKASAYIARIRAATQHVPDDDHQPAPSSD